MTRWLLLALGLGLAAAAGYGLLTAQSEVSPEAARGRGGTAHDGASSPDEIGEDSREALRKILREAEGGK